MRRWWVSGLIVIVIIAALFDFNERKQALQEKIVEIEKHSGPKNSLADVYRPDDDNLEVMDARGIWVQVADMPVIPFTKQTVGSGTSFTVRAPRSGKLEELYRDVVVRTRAINAQKQMQVIIGAIVKFNGHEQFRPAGPHDTISAQEITDPEWKPKNVAQQFGSIAMLRQYAVEHHEWVVIGSKLGAPLFGYRHPQAHVYNLLEAGKDYYVFGVEEPYKRQFRKCDPEMTHIGYRYAPEDNYLTQAGPGCVSAFGFEAGKDPTDLDNLRLVIVEPNGDSYNMGWLSPAAKLSLLQ